MFREGQGLCYWVHWYWTSKFFALRYFQYIDICMDDYSTNTVLIHYSHTFLLAAWGSFKDRICGCMLLYMSEYPVSGYSPSEVNYLWITEEPSSLVGSLTLDAAESRLPGEIGWGCEPVGGLGVKIALHQSSFSVLPCVERFSHFHPKQCNKNLSQPFHLEILHPPKQILKRKCRFWPLHIPVISTD